MMELITHNTQRLEFDSLYEGDQIQITTGQAEDAWQYDFTVENVSHWPEGKIVATSPKAEKSLPMEFSLHGCGRWTSRKQNPVQTQERGFTPYYEGLLVGSYLWGKPADYDDRIAMDRPGQEISRLLLTPYRENLIAEALTGLEAPASVRQIMEHVANEAPIPLVEVDVRATLKALIEQKRIALLKGKVQKFDLLTA